MIQSVAIQKLTDLGLNRLEATVYLRLLVNPPMTAYRMAKLLDKPAANVYKAFDTLLAKGAALLDNDKSKVYRAVPAEEFLAQLQSGYNNQISETKEMLKGLETEFSDEKVYEIETVQLALEKAKRIIQQAEKVVIVDAFPLPMAELKPLLIQAVARGIQVYVQSYEPMELPGVELVTPAKAGLSLSYWKSQQMNVVGDGKEYILALFDSELSKVYQANWSQNLYLSVMVHAGLFNEFKLHRISSFTDIEEMKRYIEDQKFFYNSDVPGVCELFQRHRYNH